MAQKTYVQAKAGYKIKSDSIRLITPLTSSSTSDSIWVFRASDSTTRKLPQSALSFSARELKFITDTTENAPVAGDSLLVYPLYSEMKLNISRNGRWQYDSSSVNGYERSGDTIKFHPPLLAGERVIIQAYNSSSWAYDGFAAPPPVAGYLAITTTNLVESPTGTWANAAAGGTGVTTLAMASDGYIQADYLNATSNNQAVIGLDENSTNNNYTSWKYGVVAISGTWYKVVAGTATSLSIAANVNDNYRLRVTGTTVTIEINGSTVYTFATAKSGTLHGKIQHLNSGQQISNVKGVGFN